MEQESERVDRKRTTRAKSRQSLAESPLRANSSTPKKRRGRKPKPASEDFWAIKDIIAEETRANGQLWYKIDWEDHPRTGEPFPQSWEPAENATDQAVRDWERKKQLREAQRAREQDKRKRAADSEGESPFLELDDSQPIRPAKRRRVSKAHITESPEQAAKRPWRKGTAETARFQSVSQEEPVESPRKRAPSEIKDSYEEEQSSGGRRSSLQVVLRPPENFDPTEYQSVETSQPSQLSQPPQPSQPSHSTSNPASSAAPPRPRSLPRPFLWDEDHEDLEIPETQELPGSSSYNPPETQIIEEGSQTATNPEDPVTSTDFTSSRDETSGSNPISRSAESSGYRPSTSDIGNSQLAWEEPSAGEVSSQTHPEPSQEAYSESQVVANSSSSKVIGDSVALSLSTSNPEASRTTEPRTSSSNRFWDVVGVFGSQEGSQIPAQAESPPNRQPDYPDFPSSFPFQTQLPLQESEGTFTGGDTAGSADIRHAQYQNDSVASGTIPRSVEARQSPVSRSKSPQRRSIPQAQSSSSSFEPASQAIRAVSLPTTCTVTNSVQTEGAALQSAQQSLSQPRQITDIGGTPFAPTVSPSSIEGAPASPFRTSTRGARDLLKSRISDNRFGELLPFVIPSVEAAPQVPRSPHTPRRSPLSDMDSQSNFGTPMDTKALMKQARAAASAKRAAAEAASREASTLPPSPSVAVPNQMLPLRETVTEPAAVPPPPVVESAPSPKSSPEPESDSKGLRILPQGPNDYIVPLPMVSQTRDIYVQTIGNYKRQRLEFLSENTSDPSVVQEIDAMLDELGKLCDHSDLVDDDFSTQRAIPVDYQARYAETVSTKCIFVAEFIDVVRPYAKHIVIAARSERMQEILEALLNYHGFEREDPRDPRHYHDASGGPLKVSLLERGITEQSIAAMGAVEGQPTPVVVSFDSPSEYNFRGRPDLSLPPGINTPVSLISLVVTHSIEHLELCIDKQGTPLERKQLLVDCLSQLQEEVGKLGSDHPAPPEAAAAIAGFLVNTDFMTNLTETSWPIPTMPEITGIEFGGSSQTQSRSDHMPSYLSTQALQSSGKRQLGIDEEIDSDFPKRQRLSPLPSSFPEQPSNRNISHISDTILPRSSEKQATKALEAFSHGATLDHGQVALLVQMINELQSQNAQLRNSDSKLQTRHDDTEAGVETQPKYLETVSKIRDLEQQLRRKEASEAELRERSIKLEARCKDLETGVKEMQPKYQEALNERGHFEYETTDALRLVSTLRKKHDDRVAEVAKLREQNNTLEVELVTARAALSESSIPEVAAFEKKEEEIRAIKAENERLQRRLNGAQNEVDFMRNQYQEASTAHGEAHRELKGLREELTAFRNKAQEDRVRIHEIYANSEVQQHLDRNKELKAENDELYVELEKKIEELKIASNRRGTRGASVPRSPRMGNATMSPGPQRAIRQVMNNIAGGSRSRGSSPAPGEVPTRTQFGEPLIQGPPRTWGTHLQG